MRPTNNQFQKELKSDVERIKKCEDILVKADKTENIYKMSAEDYEKKITEELSKDYKKVNRKELDKVNIEAAKLVEKLGISDRVEKFAEVNPFISLKDHKEDFNIRPKVRLINPSHSNVGKISRQILQRVNKEVREKTRLKQWTNSEQPVKWFKDIENKKRQKFVKYDIDSFYPSISKELYKKAIGYAKQYSEISEEEEEILWHSRKSFVVKDGIVWVKRVDSDFDVTIGSEDGAEVAETVGLYLLSKVVKIFPNSGLYRDDGAGTVEKSGPEIAKLIKKLHKTFNEEGLKIVVEGNLKRIDFLDFEMDLENETVKPWRKPNSEPKYINVSSSHPRANIKSLPGMISKRLSSLSSSENEFKEVVSPYNEALKVAGYKENNLQFEDGKKTGKKRNRGRKVLWFNPPFSSNVYTNLTKIFRNLLNKHFRKGTWLGKMFNVNNCKLSYSTMPNLNQIISGHNKKILDKKNEEKDRNEEKCRCRGGVGNCPVEGRCKEAGIIYEAEVKANNKSDKKYLGCSATTFKKRHANHKSDFKNEYRRHATKLSGYVWKLKEEDVQHEIKFKIVRKAKEYNPKTGMCNLCINEKLMIMEADQNIYLNDRTEILNKCRHSNKYKLSELLKK
jgi:hypothetical protein